MNAGEKGTYLVATVRRWNAEEFVRRALEVYAAEMRRFPYARSRGTMRVAQAIHMRALPPERSVA